MLNEPDFEVVQVEEGLVDYALALALVASPIGAAADTIFKCKGADGSMHYQSTKCVASAAVSSWGMREAPAPVPEAAEVAHTATLEVSPDSQGIYYVAGRANGTSASMMIDTGASYVTIPESMKEQLGLICSGTAPMGTANGVIEVCVSKVRSLKIGPFELRDVRVLVSPIHAILLGQSALRNFKIEQENGKLRLSGVVKK